jgi:hypothetical protein
MEKIMQAEVNPVMIIVKDCEGRESYSVHTEYLDDN